jgi:hypothetical protein
MQSLAVLDDEIGNGLVAADLGPALLAVAAVHST